MSIIFADFQPLHFIAVTEENAYQLESLAKITNGVLWLPEKLNLTSKSSSEFPEGRQKSLLKFQEQIVKYYPQSLAQHIANIWDDSASIIFSLTIGAVIRLISPLLTNKKHDPAIIVIDPHTQYVISLMGGHQANADKLTELIAHQLDAKPIITSASYNLYLPPIDTFGDIFGWKKGAGDWTKVSINIARNQPTLIKQDCGLNWWQNSLPSHHPFIFDNNVDLDTLITGENQESAITAMVYIGAKKTPIVNIPCVSWHPPVLWVGIGCERNTSSSLIESAVTEVLDKYNLSRKAIASFATIDLKIDEVGILALADKWHLPLHTFTAEELNTISVPNPSIIVKEEVGTPSVAEASALKAALLPNLNLVENQVNPPSLIVPKQIIRQEGEKGAVTVAIAQSALEYNYHDGKLYLIGTGPGSLEYLTSSAKTALREADIIIGYGLYIDLIKSLLRPEQIIESSQITQERQRAERAIELAKWGLKVAVISSGDCGIYGMAGLVLEILQNQNWDGKQPPVQVFSGITAMQTLGAKIGSPLMHDFCAISLSDLLTPWDVIEKRIIAAASADFITSIYNPRSNTRTQQIINTQKIFLQYRHPNTPVAIARSLTRDDEHITITTLAQMLNHPIDMLTTVMIGNSTTKRYHDLLITPRGYLNK
ncbi:precorrin-3B C(17)-methyltransferase [Geminocystis sp. GBBB08]|uniref:precorrin-3B C(17)-methyltransferase n=1 Tax=Geminocystis sp. GBBB08 TaxID=2604140 RepID=UPI0027E27852|nr:precorrin-3B C(17)-methyltransferase [Geminocystis sp. GBBB08]MBL1211387.1 precorrin-3B C(17)-methyltransferase [Geminocystis sp. GBBB08]